MKDDAAHGIISKMSVREEVKVKCCCDTCAHYPCDVCKDDPDDIDLTRSVCACWDPHPDTMDDAWYNLKDEHSLSGHTIKIPEPQCFSCCKSEVHIVFRGSTPFRAVVCDYNYPDDPGILHCVMKGECPYFSPTSTKRVVDR